MGVKLCVAFVCAVSITAVSAFLSAAAFAQSGEAGCSVEQRGAQNVWTCPGGLTIVEEKGARFSLQDRNNDGNVDLVRLWRKALLLDFSGGAGNIEVVTPQAITAVRGTNWAVDVASGKTSVFVVRGAVGVRRPSIGAEVVLRRGDGVDVESGAAPLQVKQWGAPRVAALMARFGQ
jgi:ferric-dicitrate binding protein FerR (iron transport regulator)